MIQKVRVGGLVFSWLSTSKNSIHIQRDNKKVYDSFLQIYLQTFTKVSIDQYVLYIRNMQYCVNHKSAMLDLNCVKLAERAKEEFR